MHGVWLKNEDAVLSIGLAEIRRQLGQSPTQLRSIVVFTRPSSL